MADFFRRADVMTGPALVRIELHGRTLPALSGSVTEERNFLDPESARQLTRTVRLWRNDLTGLPMYGETCTINGQTFRIISVRSWLDFVVLGLAEEFRR